MIISKLLFTMYLHYLSIVINNFLSFKVNEGYHFLNKKAYFSYLRKHSKYVRYSSLQYIYIVCVCVYSIYSTSIYSTIALFELHCNG